ncbi:aminotransferase class v [Holotrichia oblita]|uniref:Aminotransferase class v n=1 Tax=Holotrichia oblita TaxID=644536 RepID=A0ACB9T0U3_HOLOL|nr:aminotransferase class v [Holotrichia oblita]
MLVEPPKCLRKPLFVPNKLLMGPGPSNCPPRVLQAMSQQTLGHLHTETTYIMDEIKEGIKYIFQTRNTLTLCVSAAGHAAIEAVMCNLLEPGDVVLIAVNGIWGDRASDMAERYGAIVRQIRTGPGNNFTLNQIEEGLIKYNPVLFFIVQGESSTGCYQPLEGLGICVIGVDTVASLGSVPVKMDEWSIDAIYTGSQKCLSAPPGITPMSFSKKAENKIFTRKTPVKVYYLDMKVLGDYWYCFGKPRIYHHTVSATLVYGLREALAIFCEEGIDNSIRRHQMCANKLYEGLDRLGMQLFIRDASKRLPTVTTIEVPDFLNWKDVVEYAMKTYYFEISGGLGPTTGKVFRIGLMGYNATSDNVDYTLKVLEESLNHARSKFKVSKL